MLATLAFGWLVVLPVHPRAQEAGERAYSEQGCARCHSVEAVGLEATVSERMRGPDLTTVGDAHDEAWIVDVVKRETEIDGARHPVPFRGTDEELSAISAWLVGLE